jgi:DNA-binding NarL/FixJ family response regulator
VNRLATDRTIRVVIAENQTLMAEGLQKLLECEFESVTIADNGRELLDTVAASKPDGLSGHCYALAQWY